ncbi:MAG TPA: hypothetical protein VJZ27_11580, partial [Aggregatilineales bacterium]|nr:hypothetical protein [Aggregatilineales bacterium]
MKSVSVGTYDGLKVLAKPSAIIMSVLIFMLLLVIAIAIFDASIAVAVLAALGIVLLHWALEIWHQYGHYR